MLNRPIVRGLAALAAWCAIWATFALLTPGGVL
jgi:hypothetical protein